LFYFYLYFRPSALSTFRPYALPGLGIFFQYAPQIGNLAGKQARNHWSVNIIGNREPAAHPDMPAHHYIRPVAYTLYLRGTH
jgi:hypothetical protein